MKYNTNENKKNNTFNLVIGIATLVIALLGATFAYFTMTAGSEENAVQVKSAYVSIEYNQGNIVSADDLIPTSESVMLWAYQQRVKETYTDNDENEEQSAQCVDSKNRKVCYVFEFSVKSDGSVGEKTNILGTILVQQNEFVEEVDGLDDTKSGLSYMVYEIEEDESGELTYNLVSSGNQTSANPADDKLTGDNYKFTRFNIPTQELQDDGSTITNSVSNYLFGTDGHIEITNNEEHRYQLVIWLHDDNYSQDSEQNKSFSGTIKINVNSEDNMGGIITGTKDTD